MKMFGSNYMIQNTLNKLTLAENIIEINENNRTNGLSEEDRQKIFTYDNTGYALELVKNKNIFNIYLEDTGDNNLGKIYLLLDESGTTLIGKSEQEIDRHNTNLEKLIKEKILADEGTEELEKQKLNKTEFIIEPYKLNLFNKENHVITHYENFVNNFNYEKFNLLFTLEFKHIIIPKIFKYENDNKLTNNTDKYNIYPLNWIAGPEPEPGSGIQRRIGNRNIDVKYKNLYNNVDKRQLLISENYKTDKINTTKGKKNMNEMNELALWRLIFDDINKTYEIKNVKNKLSILKQVEENSRKFFQIF